MSRQNETSGPAPNKNPRALEDEAKRENPEDVGHVTARSSREARFHVAETRNFSLNPLFSRLSPPPPFRTEKGSNVRFAIVDWALIGLYLFLLLGDKRLD